MQLRSKSLYSANTSQLTTHLSMQDNKRNSYEHKPAQECDQYISPVFFNSLTSRKIKYLRYASKYSKKNFRPKTGDFWIQILLIFAFIIPTNAAAYNSTTIYE
jgi:hypothetical protein